MRTATWATGRRRRQSTTASLPAPTSAPLSERAKVAVPARSPPRRPDSNFGLELPWPSAVNAAVASEVNAAPAGLRQMQNRTQPYPKAQPIHAPPQQHPRAPADCIVKRRAEKVAGGVCDEQHGRKVQCRARHPEPGRQYEAHQERARQGPDPLPRGAAEEEV